MTKVRATRILIAAVMGLALVISFAHIVITFAHLGAGWDRWAAPFLIDTIAIIGRLCMSPEFSAPTRRSGRTAFWVAGIVSLACNVAAGFLTEHYGSMLIGVIVVSAALWGEGMITRVAPKATRKPAAAPKPAVDRSAASRKAAATRKANAARKAAETLTHPAAAALTV